MQEDHKITYMYGDGYKVTQAKDLPPLKAVRAKCLDCSAGSPLEVKLCPIADCPLFPYRFGKNPFRKPRNLTEEQRKAIGERLRKARS